MLFHVTISHSSKECPGRRPNDPPELVAPSDTREKLARELGVTAHFVLWSASCMMWAQPEHVAFAVVEADDLESVVQYVTGLIPPTWSTSALPVWNLPAQLRLIRQIRTAAPLTVGQAVRAPDAQQEAAPAPRVEPGRPKPSSARDREDAVGVTPTELPAVSAPGTITRMLRELDSVGGGTGERDLADAPASTSGGPANPSASTTFIGQQPSSQPRGVSLHLACNGGPAQGRTFVVDRGGASIGRSPECSVCLPDERLSRQHAVIEFRDAGYWLTDLGSRNGTAINGSLVKAPHLLQDGDSIELGGSLLVASLEANPPG